MDTKFKIVKKYIDEMDYFALLAGGAPENEFDMESAEISRQIYAKNDVEEIAKVIAQVFEKNFGEHEDAQRFLLIAEKIKGNL